MWYRGEVRKAGKRNKKKTTSGRKQPFSIQQDAIMKKIEFVDKQLSSGKMTINDARKAVGLLPVDDPGYNVYFMSEKFCNNKKKNL